MGRSSRRHWVTLLPPCPVFLTLGLCVHLRSQADKGTAFSFCRWQFGVGLTLLMLGLFFPKLLGVPMSVLMCSTQEKRMFYLPSLPYTDWGLGTWLITWHRNLLPSVCELFPYTFWEQNMGTLPSYPLPCPFCGERGEKKTVMTLIRTTSRPQFITATAGSGLN